MVNFEGLLCRVWETTIRVDRIRVSGSCRVQDAGTNFTAYFNHCNMLFCFCVFGVPDTFHYVKGPASITAFNSQTSNRVSYAARVTPTTIGTSRIGREGLVTDIQNRVNITDSENFKLLFVISLHIFRHWNQERIGWLKIDTTKGNKEEFGQTVNVMKHRLVARGLLPETLPDPIVQVNFDVVPAGANRRGVVRQEVDFALHPQYPEFNLAELVNAQGLVDVNALWEMELLEETDETDQPGQPGQPRQPQQP